eukprot:4621851-Amphidinium_carterae.1
MHRSLDINPTTCDALPTKTLTTTIGRGKMSRRSRELPPLLLAKGLLLPRLSALLLDSRLTLHLLRSILREGRHDRRPRLPKPWRCSLPSNLGAFGFE